MSMDRLYQDIILRHARAPGNFGDMPQAAAVVERENPTCGDSVKVMVKTEESGLAVRFTGYGCSISIASASIMTGLLQGRQTAEARAIAMEIIEALEGARDEECLDAYHEMAAFKEVRRFSARVKCATLPWHALSEALAKLLA